MTDELQDRFNAIHAAYDAFSQAIRDYYTVLDPDVYIDGWVLITHKRSAEWEQGETSAVGVVTHHEQSWVVTRGLLDIAYQREVDKLRALND